MRTNALVRGKQVMVAAIVLGALSGVLGFLPLFGGLRLARRVTETSNLGHMGLLLLSVLASFLILFVTLIVCVVTARDLVLPFALAEVLALIVVAIGFGVVKLVRK